MRRTRLFTITIIATIVVIGAGAPASAGSGTMINGIDVGTSYNQPHTWGACSVQDFNGGPYGHLIVDFTHGANVVRNGMLWGWFDNGGAPGAGCARNQEYTFGTGVREDFDRISLHWQTGMDHGTALTFAALGDSYSSGEGNSPYLTGTDTSSDRCHRSRDSSYSDLLHIDRGLGALSFVACSGALTADFSTTNHSNSGEPAQLGALNPNTGFITLTIGGNDTGFSDVISQCTRQPTNDGYGCSTNNTLNTAITARLNGLAGTQTAFTPDYRITSMQSLIEQAHGKAPNARIYVAGYPHLFGNNTANYQPSRSAPSHYTCELWRSTPVVATIDYADAQWLNKLADSVDSAISSGVRAAAADGIAVTYVDSVANRFNSHGLCDSSTPWFFNVSLSWLSANAWSLHPTGAGQNNGYEAAFLSSIG